MLTNQEKNRYLRQIILDDIDILGQEKISNSKILLIGVGAIGCSILENLARMGVNYFIIVEFDKVEITNIHRQNLYNLESINKYKSEQAKEYLLKINPLIQIDIYKKKANKDNISHILKQDEIDLVVDATDNIDTKLLLNKLCFKYKKKLFYTSAIGFSGQFAVFDPLQKNLACLNCLYLDKKINDDCNSQGVLGVIPNLIGNFQALDIILFLLEKKINYSTLNVFLGLNKNLLSLKITKNSFCKIC